jgi:hypothetical protein
MTWLNEIGGHILSISRSMLMANETLLKRRVTTLDEWINVETFLSAICQTR